MVFPPHRADLRSGAAIEVALGGTPGWFWSATGPPTGADEAPGGSIIPLSDGGHRDGGPARIHRLLRPGDEEIVENTADILGSIGATALVELKRIVPRDHARILVKVESSNPTGSMKERMALSVVDSARKSGRLVDDGRLVEYTGGSTGTSLAFVCAARGRDRNFKRH